MKTYWVTYYYRYSYLWGDNCQTIEDFDSGRFHCKKKDIKKEVEKHILEDEIPFADYDDCKLTYLDITDYYETSEFEI